MGRWRGWLSRPGFLILLLYLAACSQTTINGPQGTIDPPRVTSSHSPAAAPSQPPTSTSPPPAAASPPPPTSRPPATTNSPQATASTPDPYPPLTITALAARTYGGGQLAILDTLEETETYTRYLITYPSDGLTIYGFLSVPKEGSRFPVVIIAHGYIPSDEYEVEAYSTRYATALTEAGFMVIHPNLRNYPPSDSGPNPYRIGYAIDLLNLIAIVRAQSQDPLGYLRRAASDHIFLMGHSMGGNAVLRAITVWPTAVQGAVLYGAMSGDEYRNYRLIRDWHGDEEALFELSAPAGMLPAISPIYHLERIQTPISIHHSLDDEIVPPAWSEQLCQKLSDLGKSVECFSYDNTPHTFNGYADTLFVERMIAFFVRTSAH